MAAHEGANNIAYALFRFHSPAAYEEYRKEILDDPEYRTAFDWRRRHAALSASSAVSFGQF